MTGTRPTYHIVHADGAPFSGGRLRWSSVADAQAYIDQNPHLFSDGATVEPAGHLVDHIVTVDDALKSCPAVNVTNWPTYAPPADEAVQHRAHVTRCGNRVTVSGSIEGVRPGGEESIDLPWPGPGWRVTGGSDEPHIYNRPGVAIEEYERRDAEWIAERQALEARRPRWEPVGGEDALQPADRADRALEAFVAEADAVAAWMETLIPGDDGGMFLPDPIQFREHARRLRAAVAVSRSDEAPA